MSLLLASLLLQVALAGPDPAALIADWAALGPALRSEGRMPPRLSEADLRRIAAGETVRRRVSGSGTDRAQGAMWSPLSKEALWIAILDDKHDTIVSGLREEQLPGTTPNRKLLFQHIDLPWPLTDRQWVIDLSNNRALYQATEGRVWERTWTLADPTLATHPDPEGVWLPANDGAWFLASAGGGTLAVYQVHTLIGGIVPDEVATRWALSSLREMLDHVSRRATVLGPHYQGAHEVMVRPDGSGIAPGSL